jgi:hypothetical protein
MKAKHLLVALFAVLLFSGFDCVKVCAQRNIDRVVRDLEDKGVDENTVVKRNKKNHQVYKMIKNLTFYSLNSNYARQFKKAFEKDSEDARSVFSNLKGNNVNCYSYTLIFENGKKKSTYSITVSPYKPNPLVNVSIIISDPSNDDDDESSINYYQWKGGKLNGLDPEAFKKIQELSNSFNALDFSKEYTKQYEDIAKQCQGIQQVIDMAQRYYKSYNFNHIDPMMYSNGKE